jgi:hypothetical protein
LFGLKQRYRKYTKYLQETHSNARENDYDGEWVKGGM